MGKLSWEEMFNHLLQDPDPEVERTVPLNDGDLLGLENAIELGEGLSSGAWWTEASVDTGVDQIDSSELANNFLVDEDVCLPGLSSELSSLLDGGSPGDDNPKTSSDTCEASHNGGVSSPGSCSRADPDCRASSNSAEEAGVLSSSPHIPIVTSFSDGKATSPDAGGYSSDVGATGRSCDNFAEQLDRRGSTAVGEEDDDAKRKSRLLRNRESATQSRLRKKSYMKELEAKCRSMESQLSMLHQTVAFTSAQNLALREELAHVRCLKGNGSESGAMEPAALPSDSLPSESPSRRTYQCLSDKWELVAFLCHVFLLTLLQALPLKRATSGESTPSKARSERRVSVAARSIQRLSDVCRCQMRKHQHPPGRRRKRTFLASGDTFHTMPESLLSGATNLQHTFGDKLSLSKRKFLRNEGRARSSRRFQRKSLSGVAGLLCRYCVRRDGTVRCTLIR